MPDSPTPNALPTVWRPTHCDTHLHPAPYSANTNPPAKCLLPPRCGRIQRQALCGGNRHGRRDCKGGSHLAAGREQLLSTPLNASLALPSVSMPLWRALCPRALCLRAMDSGVLAFGGTCAGRFPPLVDGFAGSVDAFARSRRLELLMPVRNHVCVFILFASVFAYARGRFCMCSCACACARG
jgi:hypothetical protein